MTRTPMVVVVAAVLIAPAAEAHHSPSELVERLTERIAAEGAEPSLLVRRGDELRVIGAVDRAIADYSAALAKEPGDFAATTGLIRAQLAAERSDGALRLAEGALTSDDDETHQAELHALAARASEALDDFERALEHWNAAVRVDRPEIDWLLSHANCLQRLGRPGDAAQALNEACQRNPSRALRRAWISSLIESGDTSAAGPLIEAGLERSRLKASWLLLRARLRARQGAHEASRDDARAAYDELTTAVDPRVENPILEARIAEAKRLLSGDAAP